MTNDRQITQDFKEFLIRNKALKKFEKRVRQRTTKYDESLKHLSPEMFISGAFIWYPDSKFWGELDEKWKNYVKENRPTQTTCKIKS